MITRGHAVAQLVEALCYKAECHGFDSRLRQFLTEMRTRNLPEFKGRAARKAENLIAICELIV
jgi:hypothetical protein